MLYGLYLGLFRKGIAGSNRKLALIGLLFLLEGVMAYLTREIDVNAPVEYLILVPVASMLLTIIFDSRVGFYGTVLISLIVAGIRGNDYSIALASLVAGALAVYTVRDMKNRTQIFRSLGFIFLGYAMAIIALGLERFESLSVVSEQLAYAMINAVISPVLTYGLLIFLEKTFRVTTDLTLMELVHFNHPLLRQLAEQAPGTYHHSMTLASLSETAAAAVGANEILCRVGAYFHDIGKVVKPTYFVENQKGSRSRHDKLAPRMSSLIIAAHVKDGIALAREHGLPEEVIDFIPMHHGTTRMDYFYTKALDLARSDPDETKIDEIKEQDYRYPGPKPRTKETGILMLADTVEAAVRTIDDPTPQRLEQTIEELIRKRLEEGELDECPLTVKDLTKIRAAFLSVLIGIYHTRVKYPEAARRKTTRRPGVAEPPHEGTGHTVKEIDRQ
jgi:putative nucleotidyltransferase with HDIG domain